MVERLLICCGVYIGEAVACSALPATTNQKLPVAIAISGYQPVAKVIRSIQNTSSTPTLRRKCDQISNDTVPFPTTAAMMRVSQIVMSRIVTFG